MSGTGMDERRGRLAAWVARERKARIGSVEEAARRAGINRITWERVERGQVVRDDTYIAVNKAFGLKQGGHLAIIDNREPEPLDETDIADVIEQVADDDVVRLKAAMDAEGVQIDALDADDLRVLAATAKAIADRNATDRNGNHPNRRAG